MTKTKKVLLVGGLAAGAVLLLRKMPTWTWLIGGAVAAVALIPKLRRKLLPS